MSEDFSLRALVLDVFNASDSPDPAVIAELVAERISLEDRDAARARGMRRIAKEMFKGLWIEAKRLHGEMEVGS